jgi:cell division protein FtsB
MKIAATVGLSLLLIVIGWQVFSFVRQEGQLGSELADVQANLTKAQTQEASLQEETQYLSNPVNLEKELRARFNYKKPGEQMIIIVPSASSTATSTAN